MTIDIAAIRKRVEKATTALEIGGMTGAFLCVQSLMEDIPALLSTLAERDATIRELREALEHCLREHGGFTIRGETERKARAALAKGE